MLGRKQLNAPVTGAIVPDGKGGYVVVGEDGGVFSFGSRKFRGSVPGQLPGKRLVGPVIDGAYS